MKRIALITAVAATLTAPAFAASDAAVFAIQHFNQDIDQTQDRAVLPLIDEQNTVTASTRGNTVLADVFAHFNQDADNSSDLRGVVPATIVASEPTYGADIFRAIDDE